MNFQKPSRKLLWHDMSAEIVKPFDRKSDNVTGGWGEVPLRGPRKNAKKLRVAERVIKTCHLKYHFSDNKIMP